MEARFIKAPLAPVQWLLVHSYRAILRGAPPPMPWRDAHICLSPKVPGSTRLDDYRPIALGQLDMKLLNGPLTQRITEVLTRQGVVSDWQQGALPGFITGPPLFMAQRELQRGRPNYVFSFDARKAFDNAPHGALDLILRHISVPPEVIDLLLFLHTCARLRIVTAHGLTQPIHMLRGVRQGNPESPPVLWWPPLSHFRKKGFFSWPFLGFHIYFKIAIVSLTQKNGRSPWLALFCCSVCNISYRRLSAHGAAGAPVAWLG